MRSLSLLLAALSAPLSSALPLQQDRALLQPREVVDGIEWHTVTEFVVKTVDVYTTVWVDPADLPPTPTPTPSPSPPPSPAPQRVPEPQTQPPPPPPSPTPSSGLQALQISQNTPAPAPPQQPPTQAPVAPPAPSPTPSPSPSPVPAPVAPPAPVASPPAPAPSPVSQAQAPPDDGNSGGSSNSGSGSGSGGGGGGGGITPNIFASFSNPLPGATAPYTCPGGTCTGDMTFFNPSVGVGACGYKPDGSIWTDEDDVVAISIKMMGSLSSGDVMNPFCGRRVRIENTANGQVAEGTVVDKCFGCAGDADVDLSPALYDRLAEAAEGRVEGVSWSWIE